MTCFFGASFVKFQNCLKFPCLPDCEIMNNFEKIALVGFKPNTTVLQFSLCNTKSSILTYYSIRQCYGKILTCCPELVCIVIHIIGLIFDDNLKNSSCNITFSLYLHTIDSLP